MNAIALPLAGLTFWASIVGFVTLSTDMFPRFQTLISALN